MSVFSMSHKKRLISARKLLNNSMRNSNAYKLVSAINI